MFRAFASLVVLCAVVCVANAGKVSVEASSSSGKARVMVNGKPVEPGERDVDGSHVNYQHHSESGNKGSCRYSSVSVSSSGDEPTKINVQQGSGCDADFDSEFDEDDNDDFGRGRGFAFSSHSGGGHGDLGAWAAHGRDVKDRRFFDIDKMMDDLRRGGDGGNGADDFPDRDGDQHRHNSGRGEPGEKREVHADGDGYHAHARTSGNGPHRETIDTSTHRTPGGGVSRSVRVSASSSSASAGEQADK